MRLPSYILDWGYRRPKRLVVFTVLLALSVGVVLGAAAASFLFWAVGRAL